MTRSTTIDGHIRSQSHKERSLCRSENTKLHRGSSETHFVRTGRHASNPRVDQWPALLEEFDVQFLILNTDRDAELLELFTARPGWAIESQDDQSTLLARRDAGSSVVPSTVRG